MVDVGDMAHGDALEITILGRDHIDDGVFEMRHPTHVGEDIEAAESVPFAVFGGSVQIQVDLALNCCYHSIVELAEGRQSTSGS